jgi:hypothetical protein
VSSIWDILGIAETTDERAIKRAYATKLRIHSPERDPAGYMQLREAYESAKRHAQTMRLYSQAPEASELPPPEPAPLAPEPAPSPQYQALAELYALLTDGKLDEFLEKIGHVQASGIFATLDEQQDFIGSVSLMVHDAEVEDTRVRELDWCAMLATQLGAREHENIFPPGTQYWYAYQELLSALHEQRTLATRSRVQGADEISKTPGYLHVYHVITSPFDSERMVALTRSQTYHRMVNALLERAKTDSSIVIPPENREWWERTAMAGLHRPMAEPVRAAAPVAEAPSSFNPMWILWPLIVLAVSGMRLCSSMPGSGSGSVIDDRTMRQIRELSSDTMPVTPPTSIELLLTPDAPVARLGGCDPATTKELVARMERVPLPPVAPANAAVATGTLKWRLVLDESKPEVAELLAKCVPPAAR